MLDGEDSDWPVTAMRWIRNSELTVSHCSGHTAQAAILEHLCLCVSVRGIIAA